MRPSASCPAPMRRTASRSAPATAPTALQRRSPRRLRPAKRRRKEAGGKSWQGHEARRPRRRRTGPAACSAPAGAGADTTVKAFVDFQNDVTAKDIRLAVREGMRSIEHVKRFTTNGMATDQGKTSNMHGLAIAAEALGKDDPGGRADDLPPALHAGHLRRDRQPCARRCSTRRARRRSMPGPRPTARCSRMSASGSAPGISRRPARTCMPPSTANARPCARPPACSTPRRSARSRWSGRTPPNSWNCSTPIRGRSWSPAAAATASCCARTASSMMTASSAGWRRTASTSRRRPAARRAS